jgi:uncharacterized protein (DUF58 family)
VTSSFPVGLVRLGDRQRAPLRLLVHPAPAPLPPFALPGRDAAFDEGHQHWEQGGEPAGLRPWREGDRPRDLCWPAFARTGRLVVRDRPRARRARRALLVDLDSGGDAALLERTVSLAAALVDALAEEGLVSIGLGSALHRLPEGPAAREAALDLLAEAVEERALAVEDLPVGLAGAVVLLCRWDVEREASLAALRVRGLAVQVLRADRVGAS